MKKLSLKKSYADAVKRSDLPSCEDNASAVAGFVTQVLARLKLDVPPECSGVVQTMSHEFVEARGVIVSSPISKSKRKRHRQRRKKSPSAEISAPVAVIEKNAGVVPDVTCSVCATVILADSVENHMSAKGIHKISCSCGESVDHDSSLRSIRSFVRHLNTKHEALKPGVAS